MSFSKTISSELRDSEPLFLSVLPNTSTVVSEPFLCNGTQLGLELVGRLEKGVEVPAEKNLTVTLLASDTLDGEFTEYATLCTVSGKTLEDGGELFRFVPVSTLPSWKKISLETDADLSAGTLSVGLVHKA